MTRLTIGLAILVYLMKFGQIRLSSLARLLQAWPITMIADCVFLVDVVFMAIRLSLLFHVQQLFLTVWKSYTKTWPIAMLAAGARE